MNWSPLKAFENARDKFDESWDKLLQIQPFFGGVMFMLEIVENSSIPTMMTNGTQLHYSPEFVMDHTVDEDGGVQLHENGHVAFLHPELGAEMKLELGARYDHLTMNMACDYFLNIILKDAGVPLPEDALYDEKYRGMTEREIYFSIERDKESGEDKDDGSGSSNGGNDPSNDESNDSNSSDGNSDGRDSDDESSDNQDGESSDQGDDFSDDSSGDDGDSSDVDSIPKDGSKVAEGWFENPANDDGSPLSKDQLKEMRHEKEKKLITAAKYAGRGSNDTFLPESVLGNIAREPINWREKLEEFFTKERDAGNRWERPDKRFYSQGHILPTRRIHKVGKGAILNDLSGSVSNELAALWQDVVNDKLKEFEELELMIINFDDKVIGEPLTITTEDFPFELRRMSYGGTDFRPPFEKLYELDFEPDFILVLTDLLCDSFPPVPDAPVLWCEACDPSWRSYQETPPFGEVIRVRE